MSALRRTFFHLLFAAALLGGMSPLGSAASGTLFAALGAGSSALQRDAGVPSALASVVPALAVLGVLLARSGVEQAP